jgi:excisionase family DNA binding protein
VRDQEPILVSKELAAKLLSISVDTFERAVMPEIRVVRIGRRVLFAVADLDAWAEDHSSVPLVSELPQHACETGAANRRLRGSLSLQRRGIVNRTRNKRGDAGLSPAPRP